MSNMLNAQNHSISNGETEIYGIDLAWKKLLENLNSKESEKYFDLVVTLMENDSPFPNSFDLNIIKDKDKFQKLNTIIEQRNKLHTLIRNEKIEDIKEFVSKNKIRSSFNLNSDNQSILYSALLQKKYNIYAFLKSEGCNLFGKDEETYLVNLSPENKEQIKIEQETYYSRSNSAHILYLLSKSEGFQNKEGYHEKVKSWYEELNNIDEVSQLLKIIEYADTLKRITFDFSKDTIVEIEHGGLNDTGRVDYRKNRIYVAAKVEELELLGTLAHELTHYAMQVIFDNECKPYYKEDGGSEIEFDKLTKRISEKDHENIDDIISRVFTAYKNREAQWNAEMIVRIPQMLAKYKKSSGREKLKKQVPELLEYYDKHINQYLKHNLLLVKGRIKIIQLNKHFEVIDNIKKSSIQFRKHIKLERFLDTKDKKIMFVSNSSAWLSYSNIYQALKNVSNNSLYFMGYVFCHISSLTNPKYEIVDQLNSNEAFNLLVVEYESDINLRKLDYVLEKLIFPEKNRKVILITPSPEKRFESLLKKYENEIKKCEKEEYLNIEFTNLVDALQTIILKKEVVFQENEKMTLDKLIRIEDAGHVIDVKSIDELVFSPFREEIKIGSKLMGIIDLDNVVYHTVFREIEAEHLRESVYIKSFSEDNFDIGGGLFDSDEVEKKQEDYDLFVVVGIEKNVLANILGVHEENILLFHEDDIIKDISMQFILLEHEKDDINLKKFKQICHNYSERIIHFIEFININSTFMWNCFYDPYYISRKFLQIEIDVNKIRFPQYTKDFFAVSELNTNSRLRNIISEDILGISTDTNFDKKYIIILKGQNQEQSFSDLCKRLKNTTIHWLQEVDNIKTNEGSENETIFVWKRSTGKVKILREIGIKNTSHITNDESNLIETIEDQRSVIIADLPGMGKSTTLTFLSEKFHKKHVYEWIIRIDLKDCRTEINNLSFNNECDINKVIDFISLLSKNSTSLEKALLKYCLTKQGKILLLFDGFDEIRSSQQKKILSLVTFLKEKTKVKLVVTTRPYEQEKKDLEDALSVLAFEFKPIQTEECQEFLEHFWTSNLKLIYSQQDLKSFHYSDFASLLLEKVDTVIEKDGLKLMGIPLQTRMLAEAYLSGNKGFEMNRNELDKNVLKELFDDLDIVLLYDLFIERKYEIYFFEKTKLGSYIDPEDKARLVNSYRKDHQRLAFKYLFDESPDAVNLFFSHRCYFESKLPNNDVKKGLNRIGITQSKAGNIDFIHRTFAEYFVSELIFKGYLNNYFKISKKKMRKFLMNDIFINKNNNVIRYFINCKMANTNIEPINAQFHHFEIFELFLQQDKKEINSLCVAIHEGLSQIVFRLLKCIQINLNKVNLNNYIKIIQDCSLLRMAILGGHKQILDIFLKCVADVNANKLIDIVNAVNNKKESYMPLHIAVEDDDEDLINILLKYVKDNNHIVRIINATAINEKRTVLFHAVEKYILNNKYHFLFHYINKLNIEQRKKVLHFKHKDPKKISFFLTPITRAKQISLTHYQHNAQYENLKNLSP